MGIYGIFLLRTLDYGNYGIYPNVGNAGLKPSTVVLKPVEVRRMGFEGLCKGGFRV